VGEFFAGGVSHLYTQLKNALEKKIRVQFSHIEVIIIIIMF